MKELSNLLTIFCRESGYDLADRSILDVGTGTGHRLLEAAATFPAATFLAVDVSARPLAVARRTAEQDRMENVSFRSFDLMDDRETLGSFDVVLCMGVLHHLADARRGLRNLVRQMADGGVLFLYIYAEPGSRERMRRKRVVRLLLGENPDDFSQGIRMVKELGFDSFSYGWNLSATDAGTKDSLCVDSYLNVHERLFDADGLFELMRGSGLASFMTYGLTVEQSGLMLETRLDAPRELPMQRTEPAQKLSTPMLVAAYERMGLPDRYRLLDLLYEPNGYTVLGLKDGAERMFNDRGRILQNAIRIADLD